ncbi:MAG: TRC40/GET3/ArsA family transport-energizing ATPase [Tissierellales bacterium]|nr:TRC40/GET3/ArsA family transport-energizing ATPase [Tissierellales bacterium]MBN2827754.1 TRC40/GET3/ArsA family transport-energizing ATPase [Tissierellales bacterium]
MNKIVFFGGKGGVGKTTSSAAYAWRCAKNGEKTLIVSTDPAHSLCDIFERKIGSKIINLEHNLFGLEIDPEVESENYIKNIKSNMKHIVSPVIVKEIEKQLDAASVSPGSDESAVFDKLMEVIIDYSTQYDRIVIDTAPTGHTVRLLSLPELLGGWMDRLIEKRKKAMELYEMANRDESRMQSLIMKDPVIATLNTRKNKMELAREILTDEKLVSFVFVLNPEKLPIEETKKAVQVLSKYGIKVNELVVNRILPEGLIDGFWIKRKEMESGYLKEIDEYFYDKKIIKIPLIDSDVRANDIERISLYFQ